MQDEKYKKMWLPFYKLSYTDIGHICRNVSFSEAENDQQVLFLIHFMFYKTDFKAMDENPKYVHLQSQPNFW